MSKNVSKVNNKANNNKPVQQNRPAQITVKKGDSVSSLAQKYGMSKDDFMQWTGLKTTSLNIGQKLTVPMAEVPSGKGIIALAREYGMTLDEFCKLNNINKDYQPKKGEKFYVKPKKVQTKPSVPAQSQVKTEGDKAKPATEKEKTPVSTTTKPAKPSATTSVQISPVQQNQQKWGSSFSPNEIATKLKAEMDKWQRNSVAKQPFQDMLKQINSKNVQEVLKEFDKLSGKQTLINAITHETSVKGEVRKDAVMHIYDALANAKDVPAENRTKFKEILDKEFDSWGMVDTKELDKIITEMTKMPNKQVVNGNTKVTLGKGKTFTVSNLHKSAKSSARKNVEKDFKEYCQKNHIKYDPNKLDLSSIEKIPAPVVKGSKLDSYNSGLLNPTVKPNGKVVIINPGHGGYNIENGFFDSGTHGFIKRGNGKYAPVFEFETMQNYAEKTADALRAQGYAVVIAGSNVLTMKENNTINNLISSLNNASLGGVRYDNKSISFVSLHANSAEGKSGMLVCFDENSSVDKAFKDKLVSNLSTDELINVKGVEKPDLYVLKETPQIPSVLVEVEYVNGPNNKNLESRDFQNRFVNKLVSGLNEYYGIK